MIFFLYQYTSSNKLYRCQIIVLISLKWRSYYNVPCSFCHFIAVPPWAVRTILKDFTKRSTIIIDMINRKECKCWRLGWKCDWQFDWNKGKVTTRVHYNKKLIYIKMSQQDPNYKTIAPPPKKFVNGAIREKFIYASVISQVQKLIGGRLHQ